MGSVIALGSRFVLVVAVLVGWQGHTLARIFLSCRRVFGFCLRRFGWFARVIAGIRAMVFAVHASPLCGAAPTFLCR
ncbi:hypothetical protein SB861_50080, partial [Paraburkholderia sp. SIMBA_049]